MVVTMSEGKWGHSWVRVLFLDRSSGIQHGSPGSSCASLGDRAVLSAACLRHKNCRHGEEGLVSTPMETKSLRPILEAPALPHPSGPRGTTDRHSLSLGS